MKVEQLTGGNQLIVIENFIKIENDILEDLISHKIDLLLVLVQLAYDHQYKSGSRVETVILTPEIWDLCQENRAIFEMRRMSKNGLPCRLNFKAFKNFLSILSSRFSVKTIIIVDEGFNND